MNVVLATGGILYIFGQADWPGKVIVVVLCLGSAFTWSVMLTKWQQLRRARVPANRFLAQFRRERDPLHLFINNYEVPECPLYNIYRMGAEEVSSQFGNGSGPRKVAGGYKSFGGSGGDNADGRRYRYQHLRPNRGQPRYASRRARTGDRCRSDQAGIAGQRSLHCRNRRPISRVARQFLGRDERVCRDGRVWDRAAWAPWRRVFPPRCWRRSPACWWRCRPCSPTTGSRNGFGIRPWKWKAFADEFVNAVEHNYVTN